MPRIALAVRRAAPIVTRNRVRDLYIEGLYRLYYQGSNQSRGNRHAQSQLIKKKMKKFLHQVKLLLAGLLIITTVVSCNDQASGDKPGPKPSADPSELPEFSGEIKFDRTRIGQGQMVTASYVIPTGGVNIVTEELYWAWSDESKMSAPHIEKDGVSTIRFQVVYGTGDNIIAFVGRYFNNQLAQSQKKSIQGKFTVVGCDLITSFWNDSKAVVMATADEKFEDKGGILSGELVKSWLSGIYKATRQYYFTDDKLSKIIEVMQLPSESSLVVDNVFRLVRASERKSFVQQSFDVIDIATGNKTAIDKSKAEDKTYTDPICAEIEKGSAKLLAVIKSSANEANILYEKPAGSSATFTITYTPL